LLDVLFPLGAAALAYLIGSLSFAVIVSRCMGLHDPRSYGSGNPGATNVLRSGSKGAAIATLVLDALKGWLPVWAVGLWGPAYGLHEGTQALVAMAAFLGHLYPLFFHFKGGKGVATAGGVMLGIHPGLGLVVIVGWLLVVLIWRYSSLGALAAACFAPLIYVVADGGLWSAHAWLLLAVLLMSSLLVWRHRENMGRLLKGQESKLGQKKQPLAPTARAAGKQQAASRRH
jgi:glycerol-3-phosphate acyltransferase PlsY